MNRHMKRIVVKVGTGNLINSEGHVDPAKVIDVSRQIAELIKQGYEIVLVSSGAIKAGKDRMTSLGLVPNLLKKEWAGVGARHLLNLWGNAFEPHGLEIAQVWLTYTNWTHPEEYRSIRTSILSYLAAQLIPLINENDVVSQREIELMEQGISENDRLARMVAEMIEADGVLLLTDIGGVYDKDPRADASARRYQVAGRDMLLGVSLSHEKSDHGTGGIGTKLREAFLCFDNGMKVAIAGLETDVVLKFASGQSVGTVIDETSVL